MTQCAEMGLDLVETKDFLEEKCIYEMDANLVLDAVANSQWRNPLKNQVVNVNSVSYSL